MVKAGLGHDVQQHCRLRFSSLNSMEGGAGGEKVPSWDNKQNNNRKRRKAAYRPKVEFGFAHDVQQGCGTIEELPVPAVEEDELPLLSRLLGACARQGLSLWTC